MSIDPDDVTDLTFRSHFDVLVGCFAHLSLVVLVRSVAFTAIYWLLASTIAALVGTDWRPALQDAATIGTIAAVASVAIVAISAIIDHFREQP